MPKINELFEYIKNIGSGSQASIDIYKSLLTENIPEHGGPAYPTGT